MPVLTPVVGRPIERDDFNNHSHALTPAATADALTTPRLINGVAFDGSANITINAVDVTSRVPTTRSISTTAPLSGGGNLSGDLTLTISAATTSNAGTMSAADKTKLDGIASGATANAGTVTAVSITTGNGVSGSSTGGATPALSFTLGAITPSSVKVGAGSVAIDSTHLVSIGNSGANSSLNIGQDTTHNLEMGWDYNATPANASCHIAVYGYSNDLRIDARNVILQQNSGNNVGIGTDPGANKFVVAGNIVCSGPISASNVSGTNTGDQTNITGNAGTATALQTARTINGVSFNGTGNITINAVDSTARAAAATTISTTAPLTGGGDLSANRTLGISAASGVAAGSMSSADFTKLSGIAAGATANSSDAVLLARANHTGTQAITTTTFAATSRFGGRITAGGGAAEELTGTQATTLLDTFTTSLKGLAPASGGGTTNFLRADGTWAAPAGGGSGTVTSVSVTTANGVSGSVATSTTTPAITLTLGAITPTSVAASGTVTGSNLSGTNTGDETYSTITTKLAGGSGGGTTNFLRADGTFAAPPGGGGSGTVTSVSVTTANGVSGSVATATTTPAITLTLGAITPTSVAASGTVTGSNLSGTHTGTSSGTNTGDQTITLTGNVTGSGTGSFATTIAAGAVTLANMANVATGTVFYRKTAATGVPEVQTLATLKTDLGLTGTNSGDQTTITGNAGTATTLQTARNINGVSFNGSANISINTNNALTLSNAGSGAASGTTFNGGAAVTVSYNSIGAAPATPQIQSVTSSATVTPTFSNDQVNITAQAAALNLANPTGTAVDGWGIAIRIKDNATARAITYGTQYRAIGVTLPTTTVISKTLYLGMIYNAADTKWDVVSVAQEA